MIDLHCDTLLKLYDEPQMGDLYSNPWTVDVKKLKKAHSLVQDFAIYIDLKRQEDSYEQYLRMHQIFDEQMKKYNDYIYPVKTYKDIEQCQQDGRIGALLSVEEGGIFGGDIAKLTKAYQGGVRLLTLSWNYPNGLSFPHGAAYVGQGLTAAGKIFVEKMEELHMIVDVSHLNDAGVADLADMMKQPFIASHSNARSLTAHTRNLTDEQIRLIAERGGVIGLNFAQRFLGDSAVSRIADMVRHAQYIVDIGGSDVLALGTDFDGISPAVEIENIGEMDKLAQALEQSGMTVPLVEKIFEKNALRFFRDFWSIA